MTVLKTIAALVIVVCAGSANAQMFGGQADREMSANRYGQGNALRAGQAYEAEVVSVRAVTIKPNANLSNQGAGAAVGGSLGALAATQIHGGQERFVITSALGVLGGLVGAAVASPSEVPAQELVIKRRGSDALFVVTQANSELQVGQHVIVSEVGGEIRVSAKQ